MTVRLFCTANFGVKAYLRQNPKIEAAEGERQLRLQEGVFAVLNSRSVRDGAVAVYDYHSRMPKEHFDEDENPEWDEKVLIKELVEWRLKFLTAGHWANALAEAGVYGDFELRRDVYVDKEGDLQLTYLEHAASELPDLKEEEKVPCGPEKSAEERETRLPRGMPKALMLTWLRKG